MLRVLFRIFIGEPALARSCAFGNSNEGKPRVNQTVYKAVES